VIGHQVDDQIGFGMRACRGSDLMPIAAATVEAVSKL
jgi:hypothetical protein